MKSTTPFLAFLLLILSFTFFTPTTTKAQQGYTISYQTFYDELDPYGTWLEDPYYGYVWSPNVGRNFRPYFTAGRWVMTEYGNTWVSDYEWGWATFHYGRWTYDNYYGWLWTPGTEWAPAWVSWRSGNGYFGWAPLGPQIDYGMVYNNNYYVPDYWWVFIPRNCFFRPNFQVYWRGPRYNSRIIYNTNWMYNNYNNQYFCGPGHRELERYTGQRVTVYNIRNERYGPRKFRTNQNEVNLYRPSVQANTRGGRNGEQPRRKMTVEQSIDRNNNAGVYDGNSRPMPIKIEENNNNDWRKNKTVDRSNNEPIVKPINERKPEWNTDNKHERVELDFMNNKKIEPMETERKQSEKPRSFINERQQNEWKRPEPKIDENKNWERNFSKQERSIPKKEMEWKRIEPEKQPANTERNRQSERNEFQERRR